MTYPLLTSRRERKEAAYEFRCARMMFTYLQRRATAAYAPFETPAFRASVHTQLRSEARTKLRGMRQMLHALFD